MNSQRLFSLVASFVMALTFLPLASQATPIVFGDKANFLSVTGATNATGPLPVLGRVTSATIGSVTFREVPGHDLFINNFSAVLPGNELAMNSSEDLDVLLPSPIFSLGFDFYEPSRAQECNTTCVDSTFSVTLRRLGAIVDSFTFNAPNDVVSFIGVFSTLAFDFVQIREIAGGIDNEFYGEFYTGRNAPVSVSEPSLAGLFILGLASLMMGMGFKPKRR